MFKISLASRLAIALIRPFRTYLDGYLLSKEDKDKSEQDIRQRMDAIVEQSKIYNSIAMEKYISYAKDCMIAMNVQVLSKRNKSYEEVLPEVIDELTISLEKSILNSFSNEEIEEINEILKKPIVQKVLSNKDLFSLLKKYELELDYRLRMKTFENILGVKSLNEMKDIFYKFRKKYDIPEIENPEDENEGWSNDDGV